MASFALALLTTRAHADDVVELDWSAPAGCPDANAVMERIRSLAGGTLRAKERLRASGRIERRANRYRLTLTVQDDGNVGERTVDSDSCADLAGAAAVALGLLLENKRQEEEAKTRLDTGTAGTGGGAAGKAGKQGPTPTEGGARRPEPPPRSADDAARDSSPSEDDDGERSLRMLVQLPLLTLDVGPLPSTSFGVGFGLGVKVDAVRVLAVGRYYAPVGVRSADFPAATADINRLSAELWAGYGFGAGPFEIAPCVTGALDHYTARGAGEFVAPRTARTLVFALGGGVAADLMLLDWLALTGTAALRAETSRPRLVVDDLGEEGRVSRLGPVQASFAFGVTGIL